VCSAWVDSDAAAADVLLTTNLASANPEELRATLKEFWSRQEPILVSMDQEAPDEIKADTGRLVDLARQGAATGDVATLSSPDLIGPDRNIDQYMLQECGYDQITIIATDHVYQGLPNSLLCGNARIGSLRPSKRSLRGSGQSPRTRPLSHPADRAVVHAVKSAGATNSNSLISSSLSS
jgi:hypothetical protein